MKFDFSLIQPYQDADVPEVMNKLKTSSSFKKVLGIDNSGIGMETWLEMLDNVESIDQFQSEIAGPFMKGVLKDTSSSISYDGIDKLSDAKKNLFISNHRDIILDSSILNIGMYESGLQTCETAIGDNLLSSDIVKELTKLNKNFTVVRSAGPREMYDHSLTLSHYIRSKVCSNESSIWLAQREGRAKDGNDKTQQGLLKMLLLSAGDQNYEEGFRELNIRPISVSYEYDPCDAFKLNEIVCMEKGIKYEKGPEEDLQNIIAGMTGFKGEIHLGIHDCINQELDQLKPFTNINEKTIAFAKLIDQKIYQSYKLFENNYLAYDMLYGLSEYKNKYSAEKKEEFEAYINELTEDQSYETKKLLIRKYAYPLINKLIGQ